MKRLLFIALLLPLLVGCASMRVGPVGTPQAGDLVPVDEPNAIQKVLLKIGTFSVKDLQAASADAKSHNDPEAAMCWDGLIPIAQSLGTNGVPPLVPNIVGGASLFQAVRDVLQGVNTRSGTPVILKQINMACGPLYVSAKGDVIKVLIQVGLISTGAPGVTGALSGIPAALQPTVDLLLKAPLPIPVQ